MIREEYYTLSNGVKIPKLGFGTWLIDNDKAPQAVRDAVSVGYRHIDTAEGYGNERGVGEGIRSCQIPREELFITTKLEASYKTYEEAKAGIAGSLNALGLDYIDLMIIHSPQPWTDFQGDNHFFEGNLEAWKALEESYHNGKLRAIGISNFKQADIDNLLRHGTEKPMVNQILAHVGNTPFELIEYTKSKGILVEAYSPVAHGAILKNEEIAKIAKRYHVTIPQLCIRYCLQLDMLPLPKTASKEHMKENFSVDFVISDEDMEILKSVQPVKDYGEANMFPVYGGKMQADGTCVPQKS